ncbi:RICIN domain-containing protein [Streptomyces stelliscabiei]
MKIVNKNSNLELGITGSSIVAGAAVQQQSASDSANHWWKIVPAENGYYKIFNTNSGQVIGVKGASTTAGAAAVQWGDTLTADHLWSIVDAGGGYAKLVNKNSGLYWAIRFMHYSRGGPRQMVRKAGRIADAGATGEPSQGQCRCVTVCWLGSLNGDCPGVGSGGLGPGVVFGPFEPVVGHLALDDARLAAQASGR